VLRSDCYTLTERHHLALADEVDEVPFVDLDPRFYKLVHEFDRRFPDGVPSLRRAAELVVKGDWTFGGDVTVVGDAHLDGDGGHVDSGSTLGG
jgi:UTP--glucose-1-phosphate uridylyltransferase